MGVREESMNKFCKHYCLHNNSLPKSILEIGSRDGLDAHLMADHFSIPSKDVFLVEPHPKHINIINDKHPEFNLFPYVISPKYGSIDFDIVEHESWDVSGQSSVLSRNEHFPQGGEQHWVSMASITGKMLLGEIGLPQIDLVKIDVEGYTYEVIESFGKDIQKLKFLHLEMETIEFWKGQKLYPEISDYLIRMGFEEVYNEKHIHESQFDSFWKIK